MKRKAVMLGTAIDTMGGISSVVRVYQTAGLLDRWSIEYVATHCDGSRARKLAQALLALSRFVWLLLSGQIAVVHAHLASGPSFWRKYVFFEIAQTWSLPWITHLHGGKFARFYDEQAGPIGRRAIRRMFRHSAYIFALSEEWRSWIIGTLGCNNVRLVLNPVAIPCNAARRREPATLLFLGRLGKGKGTYELLQAVAKVAPDFPNLRLLAAGHGEIEEARELSKQLGIADRVELAGWVTGEAKQALLARAAIYVLPSYAENLPMSVLEAMAAGLPVISTPVGGIPSAIENGVEGLLVPPGDVAKLAEAIRTLVSDDGLCDRMGAAAREKAIRKFSAEKVIADLEAVYRELGLAPNPAAAVKADR